MMIDGKCKSLIDWETLGPDALLDSDAASVHPIVYVLAADNSV
jgi:hypothetical protein